MKHLREKEEGKYEILLEAKKLAGYTLQITSNEKHFPKRYRFTVTNKAQELSMDIVNNLVIANEIYPNTRAELEARLLYQKKARAQCRALLTLVEIAAETFGVKAGTLEEWTKQTATLRGKITKWILTDKERFKKL